MKTKVGKPRNPLVRQLIKEGQQSQGSGCHETRKALQERKFQQEIKLADEEVTAAEYDMEQALIEKKAAEYNSDWADFDWDDSDWDYDNYEELRYLYGDYDE